MCNHASDEFLHVLERFGIDDALIEHYEWAKRVDRNDYPYATQKSDDWHWAVRVGDLVIDWTARQYDESADFPAIWESEMREWRNVIDMEKT